MNVAPAPSRLSTVAAPPCAAGGLASPGYTVEVQEGHPTPASRYVNALPGPAPVRQRGAGLHARRDAGPDEHPPARRARRRFQRRQPLRVPARIPARPDPERGLSERPELDPALVPRQAEQDHPPQRVRRARQASTSSATALDAGAGPNAARGAREARTEIPLVFADRLFDADRPAVLLPRLHLAAPSSSVDTPLVNGAVRPFLAVEPRTERPRVGATEDWLLVKPHRGHTPDPRAPDPVPGHGPDTVRRRRVLRGAGAARAGDPDAPNPDPTPYLTGPAARRTRTSAVEGHRPGQPGPGHQDPDALDAPGRVTTPQRYLFHCHILEHEDNSMMRPLQLTLLSTAAAWLLPHPGGPCGFFGARLFGARLFGARLGGARRGGGRSCRRAFLSGGWSRPRA